ncbi:MAG: response regulator [Phycisphaerales bacterium]|nr:response regulator [Phycisphaerales bacterium]
MGRTLKILLADDDDSFTLLVKRAVQDQPDVAAKCELHCVSDGGEAVDFVLGRGDFADRAKYPKPDLVLLDQRMRQMDGAEALKEIKSDQASRRIPVCIYSTSTQDKLYEQCYAQGAVFCIAKPLEYEQLGDKMRLIIEFATSVLELPHTT